MKTYIISLLFAFVFVNVCFAQKKSIEISIGPAIQLPADSIVTKQLINSINSLISLNDTEAVSSKYIDDENKSINISLLSGMDILPVSNKYNDSFFYKPYLLNINTLSANEFAVQIAYIGVSLEKLPVLLYSFTFLAKDKGDYFSFASPLFKHSMNWQQKRIGMINFHYKMTLDEKRAIFFSDYTAELCKKFGQPTFLLNYYKCENMQEAGQLLGIDYALTSNGDNSGEGGYDDGVSTFLSGTNSEEYRHDMFHFFCGKFIKADQRCRITEEGSATIYGGDWGVSADTILVHLKKYAAENPTIDLYRLFHNPTILTGKVTFQVAFSVVINKYIEQTQGFKDVFKLLNAGEGEDNYFKVLLTLVEIDKNNFNKEIRKILRK